MSESMSSKLSSRASLDSLRSNGSLESTQSEPDNLPPSLTGSMVWQGKELGADRYVVELDRTEVEAIRAAVISFKLTRLPRSELSKKTFPLPEPMALKLAKLSEDIHNGLGVAVIRGLGMARFNDEESVIAFAGVSSYVCPMRGTDSYANQTLSHIRDATRDPVPESARGIGLAGSKLPVAMEYHADRFSGDVLALYVQNGGGNGGDQYLASFWALYNELLELAPDVLQTLAAPNWPFELKKPNSKVPYLEMGPVLFFSKGKPIVQLVKAPLIGTPKLPRHSTMPLLSSEQLHAIQVVEDTARRLGAKLDRVDGDIQFIHNLSIMHARSAYESKSEGAAKRHLLRMFLRDPEFAWDTPASWSNKFDDPFEPGRRQELPVIDTDPWRKISGCDSHG